jgi:predicted dehydrogenase
MMCLVVGYGSIGSRHARILGELGCPVSVVSKHENEYPSVFKTLEQAINSCNFDYVVIANNTSEHYQTLLNLRDLGYRGTIMVEKPLYESCYELDVSQFEEVFVGYNLRFHPVIARLRNLIESEYILSTQAYVGQYLPGWRPARDYTLCYSANKSAGGGVIRDLSHELDYINWLLLGWKRLTAMGGKFSSLTINSDDFYCLMLEMNKCPLVNIQLNYMDRITQRQIIVVGEEHSYRADLIQGTINIDGVTEDYKVDRDFSYREMHLAVLNKDHTNLCTYNQGYQVLKVINAAEMASNDERWIYNE